MNGISIVIPTLNEEQYLPTLLHSLEFLPAKGWEIIVVDGGSNDHTKSAAMECRKRLAADVHWIDSTRRGVSFQRNLGAQHSQYSTILFLDADTVIQEKDEFIEWMQRSVTAGCAVAIPRYKPVDGGAGVRLLFWTLHWFHHAMRPIMPYGLGAAMLTKKSVFELSRGFREDLSMNEDADYLTRCRQWGTVCVGCAPIGISTRRLEKSGYLTMILQYGFIFLWRTLFGDTAYNPFSYEDAARNH